MMADTPEEDKTFGVEGLSQESRDLLKSVAVVTTAVGSQAFKHPAIAEFFRRQVRAQGTVFHVGLIDGSCLQVMPNQNMVWRKDATPDAEVLEQRQLGTLEQKLVGSILDLLEQRSEHMVRIGALEHELERHQLRR